MLSKNSSTNSNPTITVVYDNNPYNNNLKTTWGFGCVIKTKESRNLQKHHVHRTA